MQYKIANRFAIMRERKGGGNMRFGVCGKFDYFPWIEAAGYDYYEGVLSHIAAMSQEEYSALEKKLKEAKVHLEGTAVFIKGSARLIGEAADFEALAEYADFALGRAAKLGAKFAVLGSGKARSIPEGFSREKGEAQFLQLLKICADAAQKYGMKLAIEPLCFEETNLVNTIREGLDFCKRANHPAIGVVADFFHMYMVGEDLSVLKEAGKYLIHVHIARPDPDRGAPSMVDEAILTQWAKALKECGYQGRISLECSMKPSPEEALSKMNSVKKIFG